MAIDLLSSIQGVEFEQCWKSSEIRSIDGLDIRVIGRADLVANKRATGRSKDAADVEALESLGSEP